ncbi:MAG: hypothetical protein M1839_002041 [Geoglossum umbratile]|nr:MAG: hypothetical protein M1839_002041 [Geoglossum umbratile]
MEYIKGNLPPCLFRPLDISRRPTRRRIRRWRYSLTPYRRSLRPSLRVRAYINFLSPCRRVPVATAATNEQHDAENDDDDRDHDDGNGDATTATAVVAVDRNGISIEIADEKAVYVCGRHCDAIPLEFIGDYPFRGRYITGALVAKSRCLWEILLLEEEKKMEEVTQEAV